MDHVIESKSIASQVRLSYRNRRGYTSNRGMDMIGCGAAFPNRAREERRRRWAAWPQKMGDAGAMYLIAIRDLDAPRSFLDELVDDLDNAGAIDERMRERLPNVLHAFHQIGDKVRARKADLAGASR